MQTSTPVGSSAPAPAHARGTRNLASGSRSLNQPLKTSRGFVRTVHTSMNGKMIAITMRVVQPFVDGILLIACESKKRIKRGNVLVRNRQLAKKIGVDEAYIVFLGLFDARRAFGGHARDSYKAEAELLKSLTSNRIPTAMRRTWELAGATEAQKRAWTREIEALAEELKYDRDPGKAKARKKVLRAADLNDVLHRHNPSAARARLMAALSATRDREELVPLLDAHRAKIAAQLETIDKRAMAMVSNLDLEVDRIMLRVKEAAEGKEIDREALAVCMQNEAAHFASKDVDPYGTHSFRHLAKDAGIVARALRQGRLKMAITRLDVMRRSMDLLREHEAVEAALAYVSCLKHSKKEFTAAGRRLVAKTIETVRNFLLTHLKIDEGFRHKVARNLREELARAQKAVEQGDIQVAYDALYSASRCF